MTSGRRHALVPGLIAVFAGTLAAGGPAQEPPVPGAGWLDEAAAHEPPLTARDLDHWAWRPLRRVAPPEVASPSWVRTPIDRFVLARLETSGLEPAPPADRETLIRRLSFDVTGLPPTPEEVDEFVEDGSPDAYEKLVDRLLGSPAYGERWGQHWLDLARFAETDGFEHDNVRPNAWRYRDWVIDAINRDVGYDEFVGLQVAGDEIAPRRSGALVATGFALCGPDMPDINLQEERRHMVLNDMTATVGAVFLGLQMGCAQCHDHKFDPLSQADFYRLRAFFENVELFRDQPLAGQEGDGEGEGAEKGRVLLERRSRVKPSHLMVRGDFRRPGPRVVAAFPRVANPRQARVPPPPASAPTSGLRTTLARWLTRPDNFLTTRVVVNRLWQHHFGEALVRTPSDYGIMGDEPSHPLLLDWLATELPRRHWSLKSLQRVILLSATYRQASRPFVPGSSAAAQRAAKAAFTRALAVDPDNRLLARQNRKRLEAEAIRDALLAVAGRLNSRRGGPGIMPPLPEEIRKSIRNDHWKVTADASEHDRRSIYLFVRRNLRYPFFEVFDRPDTNATCAQRSRTTTAPQSLALMNSQLTLQAARHLAGRVVRVAGADRRKQVQEAFRRALGRWPRPVETAEAVEFLASLAERLGAENRPREAMALPLPASKTSDAPAAAAVTTLCLSLLNLNEFVYID